MPAKLVESVNSLDPSDFFQKYLPPETLSAITSDTSVLGHSSLRVILTGTGRSLTAENKGFLEQCLRLIESTSAADYRRSEVKWSVSKKRREMHLPDMRYVILVENHKDGRAELNVAGFVSFMVTYEDGKEVIYSYEVHLAESWQGKGIGKKLMETVEGVGRKVGVEKSMLTVFKANKRAVKLYETLGYGEDEYSPKPRKLRNGTVKESSYVILSKGLRRDLGGVTRQASLVFPQNIHLI
jgi:ribosomal protein S18 acetylase RimI-like enzyme